MPVAVIHGIILPVDIRARKAQQSAAPFMVCNGMNGVLHYPCFLREIRFFPPFRAATLRTAFFGAG